MGCASSATSHDDDPTGDRKTLHATNWRQYHQQQQSQREDTLIITDDDVASSLNSEQDEENPPEHLPDARRRALVTTHPHHPPTAHPDRDFTSSSALVLLQLPSLPLSLPPTPTSHRNNQQRAPKSTSVALTTFMTGTGGTVPPSTTALPSTPLSSNTGMSPGPRRRSSAKPAWDASLCPTTSQSRRTSLSVVVASSRRCSSGVATHRTSSRFLLLHPDVIRRQGRIWNWMQQCEKAHNTAKQTSSSAGCMLSPRSTSDCGTESNGRCCAAANGNGDLPFRPTESYPSLSVMSNSSSFLMSAEFKPIPVATEAKPSIDSPRVSVGPFVPPTHESSFSPKLPRQHSTASTVDVGERNQQQDDDEHPFSAPQLIDSPNDQIGSLPRRRTNAQSPHSLSNYHSYCGQSPPPRHPLSLAKRSSRAGATSKVPLSLEDTFVVGRCDDDVLDWTHSTGFVSEISSAADGEKRRRRQSGLPPRLRLRALPEEDETQQRNETLPFERNYDDTNNPAHFASVYTTGDEDDEEEFALRLVENHYSISVLRCCDGSSRLAVASMAVSLDDDVVTRSKWVTPEEERRLGWGKCSSQPGGSTLQVITSSSSSFSTSASSFLPPVLCPASLMMLERHLQHQYCDDDQPF